MAKRIKIEDYPLNKYFKSLSNKGLKVKPHSAKNRRARKEIWEKINENIDQTTTINEIIALSNKYFPENNGFWIEKHTPNQEMKAWWTKSEDFIKEYGDQPNTIFKIIVSGEKSLSKQEL